VRISRAAVIALTLLLAAGVPLAVAQEPAPVRVSPQGLLFDFQDADLRLVLSALAEAGHLNLIYSELPSRHVTLRTNQPVPPAQILPLLKSLAASNGLKIIEDGAFIRVDDLGLGPRGQRGATPADTTAEPEVRLFVYRLKHARAVRLAATLQSIFGGTTGRGPGSGGAPRTLSQELRQQQISPADTARSQPVSVELAPSQTPSLPGRLRGEVQIVADEATNSLLVRAQADDWIIMRQSIETLDLRPLQVLIEVVIAEVRRTSDFQLGLSGRAGDDSAAFKKGGNAAAATLQGTSAGDFAMRVMRVGRMNIDVTLSALSASGKVRIISRPVLLAQNNQEARILIGSERPFVQVFRSLPTDAAVRDQVVQYRDVGTQLTLTPTINDDGYVNLQISQQVSNATNEVQFGAPIISTREAATHLFVKDGQTVVIGGLVDREQDRSRSGIPILKDLPLLGLLFGSTQRSDIQSELFLFVTPHIIAGDEDMDRINNGLQRGTQLLQPAVPKPLIEPSARRDSVP
jgi:general secretion pathway protein D